MSVYIDVAVEELNMEEMRESHKQSEDINLRNLRKRVIRYFPELTENILAIVKDYCIPGIEREPGSFLVITNDKRFLASYNSEVDALMLKEVKDD
jgi:hypothetical protein